MTERAPITLPQIEPYIQTLSSISELLFLPFMLFIIYITFILHLSTNYPTSNHKINSVISARKKSSMLILIFLRFYQQCFYYYYSSYITSEQLILSLLSESMIQMALIASITFITVQNMKMVSLHFKHLIGLMLSVITLDYITMIIVEVYYDVFTILITFTPIASCITVYLTVMFFRYPTNDHIRLLSSNIAYVELQEILNFNIETKAFNKQRTAKGKLIGNNCNKNYNSNINSNGNGNFNKNGYSKEIKANHNNNYNKLTTNNNSNNCDGNTGKKPIKRIISSIPEIQITFKTSFHINYYKNQNKGNNKGNVNIDSLYTNISFDFTVAIPELSISNKVKRTLNEFAQLERSLYEEINEENFSKYLIDKIPSLNLHINNLSDFNDLISNSDAITTIKTNIELFLKGIISEPGLITHSVLEFFDIYNCNDLEEFYTTYRKKYYITESIKLNVYNDLTRTLRHKPEKQITKTMTFSVIESIPNKLFEKEYTLTIRVSCENSFKIVKKNLSDTLLMINEAYQLTKEIKELKDIVKLSAMMKETNQWLSYDKFLNNTSSSNSNNTMIEFIEQLEKVMTLISTNYLKFKSNIIISDYYSDFYSSFNFQSTPIKKQSSSSQNMSMYSDCQDKFESLLNENLISYIDIIANNYIFISIDFNIKVFYEVTFKIISKTQDLIVLNKRYKFKEIKHYIDVMNASLGLSNLITLPITATVSNHTHDLNMKSKERLTYLQKALNAITNHKFFLRITYWKELIYLDIEFTLIQQQKQTQRQRLKQKQKDKEAAVRLSQVSVSSSISALSSSSSVAMIDDSFYNSLNNNNN